MVSTKSSKGFLLGSLAVLAASLAFAPAVLADTKEDVSSIAFRRPSPPRPRSPGPTALNAR